MIKAKNIIGLLEKKVHYYALRKIAHRKRKKLVEKKKRAYVDKKLITEIKSYSKKIFGSSSFWPYLALYSEIREEFIHGWIPEDYYRINILKKYNPESASLISKYKSFDSFLFEEFSLRPIMYTISGNIYEGSRRKISINEAKTLIEHLSQELIIKPELGMGGEGIKFSYSSDLNLKELADKGDFIIQPVFKQHHILHKINPDSLNTLRILTLLNEQGIAEIVSSCLKFGLGESRIDNVSAGGGICGVHPDGFLYKSFYDGTYVNHGLIHPKTQIVLSDIKIPNYEDVKKACKIAHERYPYVKFIGWDVAIGVDEKPVLIEWNARYPRLMSLEGLFGPLFDHVPK